jgi:hypothetical protein
MRDLKHRLGPLEDGEMPDRWDRIRRRPVRPISEPRRSRTAAMVVGGVVAALALGVVAVLSPLGGGPGPAAPRSETGPPTWLVDRAYRMAYANGDLTPDSAAWVLSDADTIAPAVGLEHGDPALREYLLVLEGDFTAFGAKVPPGADLPRGSVLAFAVDAATREVTDFGVGGGPVDVPGLEPFALPDPLQTFTSPSGWTLAVPPDWSVEPVPPGGVMIASRPVPAPSGDDLVWPADGFPVDGVALVVATAPASIPADAETVRPPVSFDHDFVTLTVLTGSGSTDFTALVQGPDARYLAIVRLGDEASPVDRAAIRDVVASLTFASESPTSEASTPAPGALPSADSVVGDRFVTSVELDGGALRVDPAPAGPWHPNGSRSDVEDEMWASPVFQGKDDGVLGWGLVTLTVSQHGIETVTSAPAWIAFGWGGATSCPMMTAAPSPVDLPSDGYVAVVMDPSWDLQPFSFAARSSICGSAPVGPTVEPATHVVSVAWEATGPVSNGTVEITSTPPPCGSNEVLDIAGDGDTATLAVEMTAPNAPLPCPTPMAVTETVDLPGGATHLEHAPLGYVRQR